MRITRKPVLANYYVTYRCNAKCGFCDIWEKPSPLIKLEDVENNLRDLRKLGVKVIDFTGGEPLLHTELVNFLRLAKEFGFITTVTTNGLLYPKRAKELHGLIDMLHFSLDSADKIQHDEGRGVPCFDSVMKSIDIARELNERPDILFTVFDENMDQIQPIYEEICQPNDLVLILNPVFEYAGVGEALSKESLDELEKWGSKKGVYLNQGFIQLRRDGGNHIEDPICKAASTTVVISPENKLILPCYHLGIEEFEINGKLEHLWNSPKIAALRKMEGKYDKCEGCTINCYMQPSFATNLNKYFWKSMGSTLKYNAIKGTWKNLV